MKTPIFTGAAVAIITPMLQDGSVDYKGLADLIEFQIKGGTDAVVICGTTGESATLKDDEHLECIRVAVETAAGRIPVIAGTGSNYTEHAVEMSKEAKARGADVILVDTAGRLHNKQNLMNELSKISRVIDRELPGASRETLLVLDATTGQNGLIQAKQFRESAGVTGIVLTKLDGTAKGGVTVAIADTLQIPVKYIGLGEGIEDLRPFDAEGFTEALV